MLLGSGEFARFRRSRCEESIRKCALGQWISDIEPSYPTSLFFLSSCVYLSKLSSWYFLETEYALPLPLGEISPERGHSCPHEPKAKIFPQSRKDAKVRCLKLIIWNKLGKSCIYFI